MAAANSQNLQDQFLNAVRREHIPVSIFLVNGIRLQGQIESFDQYVVLIKSRVTPLEPVSWIASSYKDFRGFPDAVQNVMAQFIRHDGTPSHSSVFRQNWCQQMNDQCLRDLSADGENPKCFLNSRDM